MKVPAALLDSLKGITGFELEAFEKVHESGEQVTSVRLNDAKLSPAEKSFLVENGIAATTLKPVAWSSLGYYLSTRPSFTLDPIFHAGAYYVQEASSMFLEEILRQSVDLAQPLKVLDLCAAPGGKSTLVQSLLDEKSLLVSNEVIKTRVKILAENITKWGAANVMVTNNDPKDFQRLPGYFDVIIVDAPCSGSGLFRKDADAVDEWSEQNVLLCSQRQQRILADILPALKSNGILIYSTCSFSREEDEDICDWLIDDQSLSSIACQLQPGWGIIETRSAKTNGYGYRFFPDKLQGEGFFIAAFKKGQPDEEAINEDSFRQKDDSLSAKETAVLKPWIKNTDDFFFIRQQEEVIAIPVHLKQALAVLRATLYLKKAGVKLGAIIRNELIPEHELALSTIINPAIPAMELDRETALQYLRRQDIQPVGTVKGWALVKHREMPLGWVKVLPNRVNNYYPKDWRILNK